jgi:hypothetical protein
LFSIAVSFGTVQRINDEITAGWIAEQQHSRERDGVPVCATIQIQGSGVDVRLPVGDCGSGGGGGRAPNSQEQEIIDLWRKLHLDGMQFSPGNLQAFAKQVSRLS